MNPHEDVLQVLQSIKQLPDSKQHLFSANRLTRSKAAEELASTVDPELFKQLFSNIVVIDLPLCLSTFSKKNVQLFSFLVSELKHCGRLVSGMLQADEKLYVLLQRHNKRLKDIRAAAMHLTLICESARAHARRLAIETWRKPHQRTSEVLHFLSPADVRLLRAEDEEEQQQGLPFAGSGDICDEPQPKRRRTAVYAKFVTILYSLQEGQKAVEAQRLLWQSKPEKPTLQWYIDIVGQLEENVERYRAATETIRAEPSAEDVMLQCFAAVGSERYTANETKIYHFGNDAAERRNPGMTVALSKRRQICLAATVSAYMHSVSPARAMECFSRAIEYNQAVHADAIHDLKFSQHILLAVGDLFGMNTIMYTIATHKNAVWLLALLSVYQLKDSHRNRMMMFLERTIVSAGSSSTKTICSQMTLLLSLGRAGSIIDLQEASLVHEHVQHVQDSNFMMRDFLVSRSEAVGTLEQVMVNCNLWSPMAFKGVAPVRVTACCNEDRERLFALIYSVCPPEWLVVEQTTHGYFLPMELVIIIAVHLRGYYEGRQIEDGEPQPVTFIGNEKY